MKFGTGDSHEIPSPLRPAPTRDSPPVPEIGHVYVCCTCGEVCRAKWQDIGVYEAWRSDCCGSLIDEVTEDSLEEPKFQGEMG